MINILFINKHHIPVNFVFWRQKVSKDNTKGKRIRAGISNAAYVVSIDTVKQLV